jgi:hypothetical protein
MTNQTTFAELQAASAASNSPLIKAYDVATNQTLNFTPEGVPVIRVRVKKRCHTGKRMLFVSGVHDVEMYPDEVNLNVFEVVDPATPLVEGDPQHLDYTEDVY